MQASQSPSRELLLAYGRKEGWAVDEVAAMCVERTESSPMAVGNVRSKLFFKLRDWLVEAVLQLSRELPSRKETLQRVLQEIMAVELHVVKLQMSIATLHGILKQTDMKRLWDIVAAKVDKMYPRNVEEDELWALDQALKERWCPALTILPFSKGGNDMPLLDQMMDTVSDGRPQFHVRPACTFYQLVRAFRCKNKWKKRIEFKGVIEDTIAEHEKRIAELRGVLAERESAALDRALAAKKCAEELNKVLAKRKCAKRKFEELQRM